MNDKDRYWDCLDRAMEASHGGRTDDALAWLDEALRAQPNGAEAHNGRGEILWDEGRIDEAGYQFELATQADPKFATAHLNRVELLIEELGEHEQAIEYCDRLLTARDPLPRPDRSTEAELLYLKSKALFYLDDLEGALFLARRAIRVTPDVAVYRAFEGRSASSWSASTGAPPPRARRRPRPESAHALYHLELALERLGQGRVTRAQQATRWIPTTMRCRPRGRSGLRAHRGRGAGRPAALDREYVEHVPVLIRDFPDEELVQAGTSRRRCSGSSSACRARRPPSPRRRETSIG
jgi:tetratricopeptide (TPR) repeat protein